jgi:hypothetical protein
MVNGNEMYARGSALDHENRQAKSVVWIQILSDGLFFFHFAFGRVAAMAY